MHPNEEASRALLRAWFTGLTKVNAPSPVYLNNIGFIDEFTPLSYNGNLMLFRAAKGSILPSGEPWQPYVNGMVETCDVDCEHLKMTETGSSLLNMQRASRGNSIFPAEDEAVPDVIDELDEVVLVLVNRLPTTRKVAGKLEVRAECKAVFGPKDRQQQVYFADKN
jgi:hypothetical protein